MLQGRVLARCPSCRQTFSTDRTGTQDCPKCGKPLLVPEPPAAELVASPPAEQVPAAGGTPWERRKELGLWPAWSQTIWQALFEPVKLFRAARLDQGSSQLRFAVLTGGVFLALSQILDRVLQNYMPSQAERLKQAQEQLRALGVPASIEKLFKSSAEPNSIPVTLLIACLSPLVMLLFTYANAGITHGFALLLGQSKRGFPATFAACAYGVAPMVLLAIPGCGGVLALVWTIVLTGVGLKETHQIKSGGAAATVVAPYLLICCFGCASIFAVITLFGGALQQAMGRGQ